MRISKRVREQAAHYCALMASSNAETMFALVNGLPFVPHHAIDMTEACGVEECHRDDGPAELARAAFQVGALHWYPEPRAPWAEAEALLRTGWEPDHG